MGRRLELLIDVNFSVHNDEGTAAVKKRFLGMRDHNILKHYFTSPVIRLDRELADCLKNIHSARSEQGNDHERNKRLDHRAELCQS